MKMHRNSIAVFQKARKLSTTGTVLSTKITIELAQAYFYEEMDDECKKLLSELKQLLGNKLHREAVGERESFVVQEMLQYYQPQGQVDL